MMMMERLLLLWWGRRSAGTDPPRTILNKIGKILRQRYWRPSLLEWSERLKSNRNYNIFQRILTYLTRMLLMKVRPRKIGSKLYKLRSCEICARSKKHTDERRFETFHFRIYGRLYSTSQLFLRCSYDGQIPETEHPCMVHWYTTSLWTQNCFHVQLMMHTQCVIYNLHLLVDRVVTKKLNINIKQFFLTNHQLWCSFKFV